MSESGQNRKYRRFPIESALPPITNINDRPWYVRSVPILLKKSPLAHERNFSAPLVRPTLGDVRDHIDSRKSDQGLSYMAYRGFERQRQLRTDIRENFGSHSIFDFFNGICH